MTKRTTANVAICACNEHAWSRLSRWGVTLVSADDADLLAQHVWTLDASYQGKAYAYRKVANRTFRLHRAVMGDPTDRLVDHVNGIGLDNRRSNLRVSTPQENCMNRLKGGGSSRFKGVYWNKKDEVWMSRLKIDRKTIYIGSYSTEEAAARAYDCEARKRFGAFASLNFADAACE